MTKINRIIMKGFKSFGNKVQIVLEDGFNCVVGPNGSGKSNVIDAICFVLGKGSAKALRAEKSSNLIYNGGAKGQPATQGEVSIFFDNKKKEFPVDDEEVKITRIIKKKGNSVYKINDKTHTRNQILELLAFAKINPDGYNIIIQGDIVNFTTMQNEKRRKLIEDIAGIKVYEDKKDKAVRELEKVDEKLKGAEIILKEKSTHLRELKKDRDQALKYKELNDKIKYNKASYLKLQIEKQESLKEDLNKRKDSSKIELDKLTSEITKFKEENEAKKKILNEITKEIESKGDKEHNKLVQDIQNLRIDIEKNKNRIEMCKDQIENLNEKDEQLREDNKENIERVKLYENEIKNVKKQLEIKEKEKEIIEAAIDKFKEKNKLGKDLENIDSEIEDIDKKSELIQDEINQLREKQQNLIREKDKSEYIISTVDESMKKVEEIEKEHHKEIEALKNKKDQFKRLSVELNQTLNDDSTISAQISSIKKEIQYYDEEYSKLQIKNAGLREISGRNEAIKTIMANKSSLGKVYGTLGELGNVSSEYATALEAVVGNRINSIVVEDDATAAKCIKFIRQNKSGVAAFIPLNKIKSPELNNKISQMRDSSGVIDLAINLVNFDSKYKKAFQYVLGNTLVVESIDVARRLGIGSARMVTKDGDIVEVSGLMQGGFRNKKRGRGFNEVEVTKKIQIVENKLAELRSKIGSLQSKHSGYEEKIQDLRTKKAELEGDIIKNEKSLHLDTNDLESSLKYKKDLENKINNVSKELDEIIENITFKNRDLAQIKIRKQQLSAKIKEMRNPRVLAEINTLEEKRKLIEKEINKINFSIKDIESQISIQNHEMENMNKILKQNEKDRDQFRDEISSKQKVVEELTLNIKDKEKEEEKYRVQFEELYQKRTKLNDEYDKNELLIEKINEKLRKTEHILNTINLESASVEAKLSGLNEEFQLYKDIDVKITKTEDVLKKEISEFEKMKESLGGINMKALDIYEVVEKEFNSLLEKKEVLGKEKDEVLFLMKEIEAKKHDVFMKAFNILNDHFKNKFKLLTTKGEAYLELENPKDPFEGGVEIKVKLKVKKFVDLRGLSGGEKTLTALAFIFAIQEYEPASFYILDEVDAALDKNNVEKLASLIRGYCSKAQYLVISHRDELISEADYLFGVGKSSKGSIITSTQV